MAAYCHVGRFFHEGTVVETNKSKAISFCEIAAKKGDVVSRHNLGCFEGESGNHTPAIRHFKIAAEAGYQKSLDELKMYLKEDNTLLIDDEFTEILRKFLASKKEMKTDQRDAWAKHVATKSK